MGLFRRRTAAGFSSALSVQCNRCGEIIHSRVNLANDPSLELDENGKAFYICRKVLMGSGHCFQQIEVVLKYDEARKLIDQQITGGKFVEE